MNPVQTDRRAAWIERAALVFGALIYLLVYNQTVPHGDALRIVRQVEASHLIWNPNHLIFDPLGYGFFNLVQKLGLAVSVLGCFEFLSIVATLATLWIFHAVLMRAGVEGRLTRVSSVIGVFAAACFLALAGSQYFFMIQMPLLVGSIYLYFDLVLKTRDGVDADRNLYWIGVLLAVATTIMFNNLILVALAGFAAGFTGASWKSWDWRRTFRIWVAAALVGFPVFILGYKLAGTSDGLFAWLLSYQGDSASNLNKLYGMTWNLAQIIQGFALVGFNYFVSNQVENAGLGTVLAVMLFGQPFEFVPQWGKIAISCVAVPLAFLFHAIVAYYLLARVMSQPLVRFMAAWILTYLVFNFLWFVGDEIFWLQIVPATWLVFLMSQGYMTRLVDDPRPLRFTRIAGPGRGGILLAFALLLLTVNTINAVGPLAPSDFAQNQARHRAMLRDGDLEIIPGWDRSKWMILESEGPKVQRYVLMNMAVAAMGSGAEMEVLPSLVEAQLQKGGRVIIARVYDIDHDLLPWYGMSGVGWPRGKIQALLKDYCHREIDRIAGVVFRELYRCQAKPL